MGHMTGYAMAPGAGPGNQIFGLDGQPLVQEAYQLGDMAGLGNVGGGHGHHQPM